MLKNFISNVIRFSPAGGEVTILSGPIEEIGVAEVIDRGIGIAPERQVRLFARLAQAQTGGEQVRQRIGIGMYLCHEIVSDHGDRMWCMSAPGKDATFSLTLPSVSNR